MLIDKQTMQDKTFTNEEIGERVAFFLKWEGNAICEAFLSALTDANYHALRKQIEPIITKELEQYK